MRGNEGFVHLHQTNTNTMKNLTNTLSQELQNQIADFKVGIIFVECGELNVRSEWSMDASYIEAIKEELIAQGHEIIED